MINEGSMNTTLKAGLAAAALLFIGSAHASTIKIETASTTFGGTFADAASYKAAVDSALTASDSVGYGAATVDSYNAISNHSLFGAYGDMAFKSTVSFGASESGTWQFRSGVDFSQGGAIFVDGTALDFNSHDMWWAGNYDNTTQIFDVSLNLAAGNHVLNIYGFERCCDGDQQAQFKAPSSSAFTTFSSTDGLNAVAAVPEPETYAMLLAGLGLIGFTASRRKLVNK